MDKILFAAYAISVIASFIYLGTEIGELLTRTYKNKQISNPRLVALFIICLFLIPIVNIVVLINTIRGDLRKKKDVDHDQ